MKKTVYHFVKMERLVVQKYNLEVAGDEDLQELMLDIDDGTYIGEPDDSFEYEPDEIMKKLDIEISGCYADDIENEKTLTKNALAFLWD